MLTELSKNHSKWLSFALKICGNEEQANDLTQEMYLKVYAAQPDKICNGYIYRIIANLFNDTHRKKNIVTVSIDETFFVECKNRKFEPDDEQQEILDKFNTLYWTDQDLIRESYDRSMRQIEKEYPLINYVYAHRQISKSIKKILGGKFETHYKNTRKK